MKLYDFNTIEDKIEFSNDRAIEDKTLEEYAILDREYFNLFGEGCI